jgi:hypothetical protein
MQRNHLYKENVELKKKITKMEKALREIVFRAEVIELRELALKVLNEVNQ